MTPSLISSILPTLENAINDVRLLGLGGYWALDNTSFIVASGLLFTHIRPVVPTKLHKILQFATILVGGHHTMWWNDILQTENMALKKARMEARRWKEEKRA